MESSGQVNEKIQAVMQHVWNEFAEQYDQYIHRQLLQAFMILAVQGQVWKQKRILEVACGTGLHSLYLAKTMLQRGSVLVCADISNEMIKIMNSKFSDPAQDFNGIEGNKFYITEDEVLPMNEHTFDIEEEIKNRGVTDKDRFVFGCRANNESLPFLDNSFDCYIANMSLMHVDNYKNQLSEALRVTKNGSPILMSVWGRRENILVFSMIEDVFEKHGLGQKGEVKQYELGANPEALQKVMDGMGYADIKMWYQPIFLKFIDASEYVDTMFSMQGNRRALAKQTPEKVSEIRTELEEKFNQNLGPNVLTPKTFEIMVISAYKK